MTSLNDRNSNKYTQTDNLYRKQWEHLEVKHNLIDAFRKLYPKRRLYTFSETRGNSKSRIDRLYLSSNIIGRVQKIIYENNQESDHKMVYLKLEKQVEMGPGIWMFNNSLLQDIVFTNKIKVIITKYKNAHFPNKCSSWEF